jgi:acyl-CoA thioesterase-2
LATFDTDAMLGCLDVSEVRPGIWSGTNLPLEYRRIFGGQLLAQAIMVATRSTPGKSVKSLSCVFPREGDPEQPLEYQLEATHDGRTFATRRLVAAQNEKVFFVATLSMAVDEEGPDHQMTAPDVGTPLDAVAVDNPMVPFDYREVGGVDLSSPDQGPASFEYWCRIGDRSLGDDPAIHQALLSHVTDLSVIGTALRPIDGLSQADSTVKIHTAVTSHQMWFHRPFRFDNWCLVAQQSPVVAGARGFGWGHAFDSDGRLAASFAQESMIRPL